MATLYVKQVVESIVRYYAPDQIMLFGSHAKGCAHAKSDLDLLVIKDTPLPRHLRGRDLRASMPHLPVKIDLIFLTPGELAHQLRQEHSFLNSIWSDTKLLFEQDKGLQK